MIDGIDISSWQGVVDFTQVASAGYDFAIIKATEGLTYLNPYFPASWRGAKAAGLIRGAYHYADPNSATAQDSAALFVRVVQAFGLAQGDLLVLDIESGSGNLAQWCGDFMDTVIAIAAPGTPFQPILYSGTWFMEPHGLTNNARLAQCGLWLAAYQPTQPSPPPLWPFNALWQYSDSGTVPGVSGPCDLNWFNGTSEQLLLYGVP